MVIADEILRALEHRMSKAEERYGQFASTHEALGVAVEEWDELRDAIRSNKMGSVEWECLDLASVLIRLAMETRNPKLQNRSVK